MYSALSAATTLRRWARRTASVSATMTAKQTHRLDSLGTVVVAALEVERPADEDAVDGVGEHVGGEADGRKGHDGAEDGDGYSVMLGRGVGRRPAREEHAGEPGEDSERRRAHVQDRLDEQD